MMKKHLFTFAILATSLLAFTSCEEEGTTEITPDAESQALFENGIHFSATPAEGNLTARLSFTASASWKADVTETKAAPWITVEPASGEAGPATISVTAQENTGAEDRSATVTISCGIAIQSVAVTQAATQQSGPSSSLKLDRTEAKMTVGETLQLIATVRSDTPAAPQVSWSSSDTGVASVTTGDEVDVAGVPIPGGIVSAVGEGEAIITAKVGDASASCKITVVGGSTVVTVTEIKLDKEELHMSPGQSFQLTATVKPEEAAGSVRWSSSQAGIASVDQAGKITAVALGETVITASAGDKSASCLVKVEKEVVVESISLNETSLTLKEGDTFQLVATLHPETATPKPIEWVSSIPAVAVVNENGLVTAVGKGGPASIWAIVNKGSSQETAVKCDVTVTSDAPSIESITVTPGKVTINYGEETILTATVTPEGTGAVINWISDNTAYAKVEKISDTQAKVTGVGVGHTKVIASVGSVFGYCEVTVEKKASGGDVESITLDKESLELTVGQTWQLNATVVPESAAGSVVWSSSKPDVAYVTNSSEAGADGSTGGRGGTVLARAAGEAVIEARIGNVYAACRVVVSGGGSGTEVPVESISLNKTELTLQVGESFQLIATILPETATNKTVSWSMTGARSYQLSLDTNGLIRGLQACEATIWVRSAYDPGRLYASCKVTVTGGGSSGTDEEVVDLGLPSGLKWRSMNVGASKPEDYGDSFAWGETKTKSSYSWGNYKFGSSSMGPFSKYGSDNNKVLDEEDDAAAVNLGNGWRMATFAEWKELREECTWKWTTRNGVSGMQVTGPNGNSIFLPAAGYYDGGLTMKESYGSYWTSSDAGITGMAHAVDFISTGVDKAALYRKQGNSVRPVKD